MRHFVGSGCLWLVAVLLVSILSVTDSAAEGFYVGLERVFQSRETWTFPRT